MKVEIVTENKVKKIINDELRIIFNNIERRLIKLEAELSNTYELNRIKKHSQSKGSEAK